MKKTGLALAIALALALVFTSCAKAPAKDESAVKTGVLVEASMHVISIQAPDGSTYVFSVDDNTTVEGTEILGNTMQVSYKGEYKQSVAATSIVTLKEVAPEPAVAEPKESDEGVHHAVVNTTGMNPGPVIPTIYYVTGVVLDASMNNIQFKDSFGNTYNVLKDDNTHTDSGIAVGCVARVFHTGSIADGMVATEIHLVAEAPAAGEEYPSIKGTVIDAMNANVTIKDRDGVVYTFRKTDDTVINGSGITDIGSKVRIVFSGVVTAQPVAVKIEAAS